MRKRAIGILQVNYLSEANLGYKIVVEKNVGGGRDGEQNRRSAEEKDGAQVCFQS